MKEINSFFDQWGWIALIIFVLAVVLAYVITNNGRPWYALWRPSPAPAPAAAVAAPVAQAGGTPAPAPGPAPAGATTPARPSVLGVNPSGAPVTTSHLINGDGFQAGATVKFRLAGQSDLTASNVVVVSTTELTFDAPAFPAAGTWDMIVHNPDGQESTPEPFDVT